MSGSVSRRDAIQAVVARPQLQSSVDFTKDAVATFGENVFTLTAMKDSLPKAIYKALVATIESGSKLEGSVADAVAAAMKNWAMAKGATHYAHVFQPLTGITAEKHDSFLDPDGKGGVVAEFSGKQLIGGEPDGSSFPSGGIRATFEARGYTIWDPTSPAYILENANGRTLCIPTAFVSWTGDALDKKTPVLRSMQSLAAQAARVVKLFGNNKPGYIYATAGPEQEYFLVDRNFFYARPDISIGGRSLFGGNLAKGQEFEDQYFGAIPARVLAYMHECEQELYKLGVPIKTRHNEVAPGQYEVAPVYENANIAADHQQLTMTVLKAVAEKHGMACLFAEKPFAGVNGSGKHLNWSLGGPQVGNLLDPGVTPHDNAQFLVFCAAVIRAVHLWGHLLRATVAHAGNDHRLGANEAPPAIVSIFLGDMLTKVFESIAAGKPKGPKAQEFMTIGVDVLPPMPKDPGDRNRTSPFAFTGNKFEFRACGSAQSISFPLTTLNTIIADSLAFVADELEKATKGDAKKLPAATTKLLQEIWAKHGTKVVFNGNGYAEVWHKEAVEKRGLINNRDTVEALPVLKSKEVVALFAKHNVLSSRESLARYEVKVEQYVKELTTEGKLTLNIARSQILPAAFRYQEQLATSAAAVKAAGISCSTDILKRICALTTELEAGIAKLEAALAKHVSGESIAHAKHARDGIAAAALALRQTVDTLETLVADDLWPLPTYQEILFIK